MLLSMAPPAASIQLTDTCEQLKVLSRPRHYPLVLNIVEIEIDEGLGDLAVGQSDRMCTIRQTAGMEDCIILGQSSFSMFASPVRTDGAQDDVVVGALEAVRWRRSGRFARAGEIWTHLLYRTPSKLTSKGPWLKLTAPTKVIPVPCHLFGRVSPVYTAARASPVLECHRVAACRRQTVRTVINSLSAMRNMRCLLELTVPSC